MLRKPKAPRVKGDPLKDPAYVTYLSKLRIPTEECPLLNLPEHVRPTLEELQHLRRWKASLRAKEVQNNVRKSGELFVAVEMDPEDEDETFRFDSGALTALKEQRVSAAKLRNNAELLKSQGYELVDTSPAVNMRAAFYGNQLLRAAYNPEQRFKESVLTDIIPLGVALKNAIHDAAAVYGLATGQKLDIESLETQVEKYTDNAVRSRVLFMVMDTFKLSRREAILYLQYHIHQTMPAATQSEIQTMIETILKVSEDVKNLPAEHAPEAKKRTSRKKHVPEDTGPP